MLELHIRDREAQPHLCLWPLLPMSMTVTSGCSKLQCCHGNMLSHFSVLIHKTCRQFLNVWQTRVLISVHVQWRLIYLWLYNLQNSSSLTQNVCWALIWSVILYYGLQGQCRSFDPFSKTSALEKRMGHVGAFSMTRSCVQKQRKER